MMKINITKIGLFLFCGGLACGENDIPGDPTKKCYPGFDWTYRLQPKFIEPSLRIYFDSGHDDVGEIDIYNDGELVPSLTLFELYKPLYKSDELIEGNDLVFSWGFTGGLGITAPAGDSDSEEATSAPVLLLTLGLLAEISNINDNNNGSSFGIEFGRALGLTADEGLDDISDSAWYVGLRAKVEF
jgi:hypothetical protein